MPNDCSNRLTITSTSENDIIYILQEIHKEIPNAILKQNSNLGIRVNFITAWQPDIQFIETIVDKYPSVWIKNDWISEDGKSGVWVGKKNNIKSMDWEDLSIEAERFFFSN
jgi:Ferredoxin-like domain in Api92-like protein